MQFPCTATLEHTPNHFQLQVNKQLSGGTRTSRPAAGVHILHPRTTAAAAVVHFPCTATLEHAPGSPQLQINKQLSRIKGGSRPDADVRLIVCATAAAAAGAGAGAAVVQFLYTATLTQTPDSPRPQVHRQLSAGMSARSRHALARISKADVLILQQNPPNLYCWYGSGTASFFHHSGSFTRQPSES